MRDEWPKLEKDSPMWIYRKELLNSAWNSILSDIGNPKIRLLDFDYYKKHFLKGVRVKKGNRAFSNKLYRVITLVNYSVYKQNDLNTLWHELGHILFPEKSEWWIECYGYIMSNTSGDYIGDMCQVTGHTPYELPDVETLLEMSKERSKFINTMGGESYLDKFGLYDGDD